MEFIYKAKDSVGNDHTGSIEAPGTHAAASVIRKKGLILISLNSKNVSAAGFLEHFLNRVRFSDLVVLTRQLATMVSSGLVLSEAIDILEEQQSNKILKKALFDVSQDVKGGLTFAQALSKFPDIFPRLFINLIRSGETAGKLDSTLVQMADGMEKDSEFQAKVRNAMIYPVIVVIMMIVVFIVMMVFVIPKITSLYGQQKMQLPLPTRILIGSSNIFNTYWWVVIIVGIGLYVGFRKWRNTPKGSFILSRIILKTPVIGKLVTNVTLTNFTRTFGLLISAGIPLLDAIGIVSDLMTNVVFKNALKEAYNGVEKGLPFSTLLTANVFPKIVSQMVRVGEETGKMDEIFLKLAAYFESESDHLTKNLTVAIEPVVLIILGLGVGFLVISIILPIYNLTTAF